MGISELSRHISLVVYTMKRTQQDYTEEAHNGPKMSNDKIKGYAIQLWMWGWIPAFFFTETDYSSDLIKIFVICWAASVPIIYVYVTRKESNTTKNKLKKFQNFKDDLFDRDIDYIYYTLQIKTKNNQKLDLNKLANLKSEYKSLMEFVAQGESTEEAKAAITQFKDNHQLTDLDFTDLSAMIQFEAIETIAKEIPKLRLHHMMDNSSLSLVNYIFDQLNNILKDDQVTYQTLFAVCYARYDSRLRKLFDREIRKEMSDFIFDEYDSMRKFTAFVNSFANEYPNYNRYDL
jgi:hypothetical protein